VIESSCCSTFLPTFGVVSVLDCGHSDRSIVVSNCYFNLHFSVTYDVEFCIFFSFLYMLICYLCIFFGEVSIKFSGSVFNQVIFLLLSVKGSLHILDRSLQVCSPSLRLVFFFLSWQCLLQNSF